MCSRSVFAVNDYIKSFLKPHQRKNSKVMQTYISCYYDNFRKISIFLFKHTVSRFKRLILDFAVFSTGMNLAIE